jgi:hypothetical protein
MVVVGGGGGGGGAATAQYRDRPVPRPHSHRHRHRTATAMDPNAERLASGASAGPSHASPYNLRARGPARRPAPASDSSESSGSSGDEARSPQQQAEQVRDGLRDLGFQRKDLNADQPGQPPAWVFWHPHAPARIATTSGAGAESRTARRCGSAQQPPRAATTASARARQRIISGCLYREAHAAQRLGVGLQLLRVERLCAGQHDARGCCCARPAGAGDTACLLDCCRRKLRSLSCTPRTSP